MDHVQTEMSKRLVGNRAVIVKDPFLVQSSVTVVLNHHVLGRINDVKALLRVEGLDLFLLVENKDLVGIFAQVLAFTENWLDVIYIVRASWNINAPIGPFDRFYLEFRSRSSGSG